jgi:hypothetical protein
MDRQPQDEETKSGLPADLTPLNLQAYFYHAFKACGCSEMQAMHETVLKLLEWHEGEKKVRYHELFNQPGVFYILAGMLDNLGLAEHGTAIRYAWLTSDGKRLLEALRQHTAKEIEEASGIAYDGLHYGNT